MHPGEALWAGRGVVFMIRNCYVRKSICWCASIVNEESQMIVLALQPFWACKLWIGRFFCPFIHHIITKYSKYHIRAPAYRMNTEVAKLQVRVDLTEGNHWTLWHCSFWPCLAKLPVFLFLFKLQKVGFLELFSALGNAAGRNQGGMMCTARCTSRSWWSSCLGNHLLDYHLLSASS